MANLPSDHFVTSLAFTKATHRDLYPAIDPTIASNSQAGKVIVVTGANRGLGRRAFVASFAKAGPKGIVLVARSEESLEEVVKEVHAINDKIEVLPLAADIKDEAAVKGLWEKVKAKFGHADILVNNAGCLVESKPVRDSAKENWWPDFEVNVLGTFLVTQGFLSLLSTTDKATIINITSATAYMTFPNTSSYALSKLANLQLAAHVAAENPKVTSVSMHPTLVPTDMTLEYFKPFALDTPELVGGTAVWLATEKAAFLTGKMTNANWDVEELEARKEEIVREGKLSITVTGKFGMEQFA